VPSQSAREVALVKRTVVPELLDTDAGTPTEVADSLADLRSFNRYFGGISTMASMLRKVAARSGKKEISFLDVAGASGDVAEASRQSLASDDITLRPILLDRASSHLGRGLAAVSGDALQLPFADSSIDCVGCSLFAHHLEPEEITRFATEALRVARYAVLINDIRRNPLHLAFVYVAVPFVRSRLTRHDAPVSIRRAYTIEEMKSYLKQTAAKRVEISSHYLFRMAAIAWKHE
jgi:ubiquinone/menaquinone biosynthesis C-methylase UbiE